MKLIGLCASFDGTENSFLSLFLCILSFSLSLREKTEGFLGSMSEDVLD